MVGNVENQHRMNFLIREDKKFLLEETVKTSFSSENFVRRRSLLIRERFNIDEIWKIKKIGRKDIGKKLVNLILYKKYKQIYIYVKIINLKGGVLNKQKEFKFKSWSLKIKANTKVGVQKWLSPFKFTFQVSPSRFV